MGLFNIPRQTYIANIILGLRVSHTVWQYEYSRSAVSNSLFGQSQQSIMDFSNQALILVNKYRKCMNGQLYQKERVQIELFNFKTCRKLNLLLWQLEEEVL